MITKSKTIQAIYDLVWGRWVFAGAYDRFLKNSEEAGLSKSREEIVSKAKGCTLEIAAGTALNLPHYSSDVTDLTLTDAYPSMIKQIQKKVEKSGRRATIMEADAENLPFEDETFDTVVASMILCSTTDPSKILTEIHRVLKKGGQYLFLEHVRNPDQKIAEKQDRIQPLWHLFGNGCHCNRDTITTIRESPLEVKEINRGTIPKAWSIIEAMITGRAVRSRTTEKNQTSEKAPCQCSLDEKELEERKNTFLGPLKAKATKTKRTKEGYIFTLPRQEDNFQLVTSIILLESKCCPFFNFNISAPAGSGDIIFAIDAPTANQNLLDELFASND